MSSEFSEGGTRVFALRSGQGAVVLHATGLRHPRFPRWLGETFTPYAAVTHHAVTSRVFRLGTRRSVYVLPRSLFADPTAPDELARALVERIEREPGGAAQLERMWQAEKLAARPRAVRLAPVVAGACAAIFVAQALLGSRLMLAGLFSASLVREGELWRLLTANLLHGGPFHLLLNALGLLALGTLVERVLGSLRSGLTLGLGAIGGMGAGYVAGYEMAVGASGMVFGLVGALVWLELRCAERLPAGWRVPRGILLAALAGDAALSLAMPEIALAAHAGGFAGGALACALVAGPALRRRPARAWVWAADALLLFGLSASLAAAGAVVASGGSQWAHHARLLAGRSEVPPLTLNNFAWMIATDPKARPEDLALALELAERAVEQTGRRDPNILDTLAEARFAAGSAEEAVRIIDEAIALAPDEGYFREQRRRFAGERDPDDRPAPPREWVVPRTQPEERPAPEPLPGEPDPGLRA